ncbi:MAG: 4-alpha-glucanotransferase [Bacteroidetes bacterium RIFOXYA12_FULL_35_11]|nr:MAG: 4-alpha-glucanotransferase [Bacteroidetes bacterium GWF2_35_48]OFY73888.1 MAG: 4-alpha-glucanotransferase [Bacteroidetes bacterium RIFOXYA12_FULL_35_11]HBX51364.1 4-alpha-glucanotransferase [Bacteroidales bacterium]
MNIERSSGILLHPTSLPGKYGIGTLGKEAFSFIDFLYEAGQKIWQILPLGPTGFGNSPYQCYSSVAGNPFLIDLEKLVEEGWIPQNELDNIGSYIFSEDTVNFNDVIIFKEQMLHKAYLNFKLSATEKEQNVFEFFCTENEKWLYDYALFMALKMHFNNTSWNEWEIDIKLRKKDALKTISNHLQDEIEYQQFIQWLFFRQWEVIKEYAGSKKINIIGDIPLYVSYDSADVWTHPELFLLDKERKPIMVAGVPPDYFSETGQYWGNPIYNWEQIEKNNFKWWVDRIRYNLKLYDIIRIDHFRGLCAYWAIPTEEETAVNGKWIEAPGHELFQAIKKELGELPIIAEDLGVMTPEVEELRDSFNFPGMKILQFAFDATEENDYLPHSYIKNCIVYTGTHDNDTVLGWYNKTTDENKKHANEYMDSEDRHICRAMIRTAFASTANLAIIPLQDILELGDSTRMNTPGTIKGNWNWRFRKDALNKNIAVRLKKLSALYGR